MDEQERQAEIRRCSLVTLIMIVAGLAVLAAQEEPAARGVLIDTHGRSNTAQSMARRDALPPGRASHHARGNTRETTMQKKSNRFETRE